MVKLGFLTLNGKKEEWVQQLESYPEFEMSWLEVVTKNSNCDAYIILGGDSKLVDICNSYMKIIEHHSYPVWIYKENCSGNDRLLLYNLGSIGVFNEEMGQEEIVKAVHNGLVLIQKNKEDKNKEDNKKNNEKKIKLISENLCVLLGNNEPVYLTKKEYKVLSILYSASPKAVSYKEIHQEIWDSSYNEKNYRIANIIFHLRVKLEKDVNAPKIVKTVRSNGYLFNYEYK